MQHVQSHAQTSLRTQWHLLTTLRAAAYPKSGSHSPMETPQSGQHFNIKTQLEYYYPLVHALHFCAICQLWYWCFCYSLRQHKLHINV